ncbi:MAG: DUF6064 family protein [Magnetospirillum sp.]|nr:DUF6064 family protein [Magnetospirillum sp.]
MEEWSTYGLQDFLLFSPATWGRLLEAHNAALWPLHLVTLAAGLSLPFLCRGATRARRAVAAFILAACWLWVAASFFLARTATINWAAPWFALLFAVEAALLLFGSIVSMRTDFRPLRDHAGTALFLVFLLAQPMAGLLAGRPLRQAELFGIMPDPTALGTLGLVILLPGRLAWLLVPIPMLWCLVAGATLWTLGAPDAWVPPAMAAAAAILLAMRKQRNRIAMAKKPEGPSP